MRLVDDSTIQSLRSSLGGQSGLRWASVSVERDSFDFARTGAALVDRAVAFSSPDGVRVAGLGTAWRASASGRDRFATLRNELARLPVGAPRAFVGFSFLDEPHDDSIWTDFAAAEAFIPRILIEGTDSGASITITVPDDDDLEATLELLASMRTPEWTAVDDLGDHAVHASPSVKEWASRVEHAVGEIRSGALGKVVLARSVAVTTEAPPPILRMFRSLVRSYPKCYSFAWKSGSSVFLGSSPELLAAVSGTALTANPLAGSAPRGEGREEDDRIGAALLASDKDRREHRYVVEGFVDALGDVADRVSASPEPSLKKMATVQHLSTEVSAVLRPGLGLLDAVAAVHPTAAVAGTPTDTAVKLIESVEGIDRGWYTGGVGWIDRDGNGAVAIALRCGLVTGKTTHLFAGAGIVEGSVAADEVEETRLKLTPMLQLLT